MSDNPSAAEEMSSNAFWSLGGGVIIATLIAGSHWLPHIGCELNWPTRASRLLW